MISRGLFTKQLKKNSLWWHSPVWLPDNISTWPIMREEVHNLIEVKLHTAITVTNTFFKKYSSLTKLIRVVAYCRRFAHNCKLDKPRRAKATLTVIELREAKLQLIKLVQQESFQQEFADLRRARQVKSSSKLFRLQPLLNDGIIRVGGRLKNANLEYDVKHPIVLLVNHKLSELLIEYTHKKYFHAGVQLTMANLRQEF